MEPGAEYDRLCAEIAEGLMGFVDEDAGEPVVAEVRRVDELFPPAPRRDALPDLIVRWPPSACADTREIVSPRFGSIAWPLPGGNPNGHSGNHTGEGFVLGVGEGILPGSSLPLGGHIFADDLCPSGKAAAVVHARDGTPGARAVVARITDRG